jgi:lysozyme
VNIDSLLSDLRRDEGWNPTVYRDTQAFFTIGYGFLVDPKKGVGLPKFLGELWLEHAALERIQLFRKLWPAYDSQPADVQRALGNMCYQLGADGLMQFSKMLAALSVGDRKRAALEALDSLWATQTPVRARRVVSLIRGHHD